jgi:hypothetical protein
MYLARLIGGQQPLPGAPLYAPSAEHDQDAGMVVDAQPTPGGGYEALVMLQIASYEAGDVRLGDAQGPELELYSPPYAFEKQA